MSADRVPGTAAAETFVALGGDCPRAPLWRTLQLARPSARRLAGATLLGAGSVGAGVALLATSGWLISRASERPSIVALGAAIVGVRLFALSRAVLRYCERLVGHDATLRGLAELRVDVFERLEVLAPAGLSAYRSGDLLARLVADVDTLQDLMLRVIPPFGIALIVGLVTVGVTGWVLPAAGLTLGAALLVSGTVVPWLTLRLARSSDARQASARGQLTTSVVELLEGAPDLVAYGASGAQRSRIAAADAELTGITTAGSHTTGIGSALITVCTGLAVWAALLVGIPAVHAGQLGGPFLAVIVLIPLAAFEVAVGLPAASQALEGVRRSAGRVFAVIDAPSPVTEPASPARVEVAPHRIRVRGLKARHRAGDPWALEGIDLDLWPSRRVALVGPSGAGKSTLAAVLLRFVEYQAGSVTLDGTELSSLAGADVRRVIGLAAQGAHIFDTTVRENLRVGRRQASDDELWDALDRTRLRSWVELLPRGLDTEVGAHGARMSGGQRQRLAVARALLADFPVLVLDEPGEHLDTATADALTADLVEATRGRSTVVITHRLAGLDAMDEIVVLDTGRVVERGAHDDLVLAGGLYARLWERERGVAPERRSVAA
jgi:thiol reductant ABC exporter CydC subunit